MGFEPQQYNNQYLANRRANQPPINDAADRYGIRIERAQVDVGETYWQVIGVHHLLPLENFSNHHIYLDVLDRNGVRVRQPHAWVGWTWENRSSNEPAPPVPIDKPAAEPGGNISVNRGQMVSVWVKGRTPIGTAISDQVVNIRTTHPDEPLPDGTLHNTWGHHSFYVVFQETVKTSDATPPQSQTSVIEGVVANGQNRIILLSRDNQIVARQSLSTNGAFQFSSLVAGIYTVSIEGTTIQVSNLRLDGQNKQQVNLTIPSEPTSPAKPIEHYILFGTPQTGLGRIIYFMAMDFLIHFSLTAGFSLETAHLAKQVTIIGPGYAPEQLENLRRSGTQVEQLQEDIAALDAILKKRVETGRPFGN